MDKRTKLELLLLSAVSLYLELLIIRWMSADIRAFTVFRTFPLVTCFVGLGVGFSLGRDQSFRRTPAAILYFLITMIFCNLLHIGFWGFPTLSISQWQGLVMISDSWIYVVAFSCMLVILLLGPFLIMVHIGARLGVLFNQLPPLPAYSINIIGAVLGSILFALLSYFELPPWLLVVPALTIIVCYLKEQSKLNWQPMAGIALAFIVYCFMPPQMSGALVPVLKNYVAGPTTTYWSPMQRIDLNTFKVNITPTKQEFLGLELGVNHGFYQYFFSDKHDQPYLPQAIMALLDDRDHQYNLPFQLKPAADVLVVGAGTGQDVAAALANGAKSVDAIDIDPVILKVGKRYNPAYSNPAVRLICDDARHYIGRCNKKYDLIVFGLLDSQAVAGQGSSVRIDTYVYTKESIKQTLKLLKPDGLLSLSFSISVPWIPARIFNTLKDAAGYSPVILHDAAAKVWGTTSLIFVLGDRVKAQALVPPSGWESLGLVNDKSGRVLTDDWPYLYIQPNVLDIPLLLVIAEVILIAGFAGRKLLFGARSPQQGQMFFFGSAFLLLELHAISHLSLLYGSTWLTSAIVINGILLMILLANFAVIKLGRSIQDKQLLIYLLLFLSIFSSYMLQADQLLSSYPGWTGMALVTTITLLPMCLAAVLFAICFSQTEDSARALAFNLFGAVVGGLLEYLSNYWGIRSLELVAALLYLCSMMCFLALKSDSPKNAGREQIQY